MSRRKLTEQQKIYVVKRLAAYDALPAIVRGLRQRFGITVSCPAVLHYDPARPGSRCLAQRWKDLFWQTRKAHIARIAEVGDTGKPARIRRRQAMMHEAWAAGRHKVANDILDSVAKDIGSTTRERMNTQNGAARLEQPLESIPLDINLHEKQWIAFESDATEILYGGAAGSGKSFLMRTCAIAWCGDIPGLQVYLFRRTRDDLAKNHVEGPTGFRALLGPWVAAGGCEIVADEIRFSNGAQIFLCHCKDEKDVYKYQGAEIHVLLIDELTHFTETMYRFLRNRVRMVGMRVPDTQAGHFPRILCGTNPGNIGHLWVKRTFIDGRLPFAIDTMPDAEGGMRRQYVPARLEDNPSMAADDPRYEARLEGLGARALVQAMRWGDWDVVAGAFFDCFSARRHVVDPFVVPAHWPRFRSADWGSASPSSVGWWAVVSEPYKTAEGLWLPRGCLVRYREYYGMQVGQPNVGLKLPAEKVGALLAELERNDPRIAYGVLDPSAFRSDGGPTIAQRITAGSGGKIHFRPADNTRVPGRGAMGGWDQVRARLIGDADGRPMMVFFSTCRDTIRTLPALQHDAARPEDVDTAGEDHAADDVRYACMSRPWAASAKAAVPAKPKDRWERFLEGDDEDDDEEVSWKVV